MMPRSSIVFVGALSVLLAGAILPAVQHGWLDYIQLAFLLIGVGINAVLLLWHGGLVKEISAQGIHETVISYHQSNGCPAILAAFIMSTPHRQRESLK